MFVVNDDLSIYATRGDIVCLNVSAVDDRSGEPYEFQPGDIVRMKVFVKKDAESVVLQKDFPVVAKTNTVGVFLTEQDTKIGDVISKPTDYWYEIELNPYTNPQTIVGYDEDGAKIFKLFPEGKDLVNDPTEPEDIPVVDTDLDLTSSRPVENRAIARAVTLLKNDLLATDERLTGKIKENKNANKGLSEEVALERFRIDNLVASGTVDGAEVLDVRIDHMGRLWGTAGDAVRGMTADLDKMFDVYTSPNLLNVETLTADKGMSQTGKVWDIAGLGLTDYIQVSAGQTVVYQRCLSDGIPFISPMRWVCAFDADKKVLADLGKGDDGTSVTFYTVPDGVSFVRVTFGGYSDELNAGNAMVHIGEDVIPYEKYGTTRTVKIVPKSRRVALPYMMYAFAGLPVSVYFRNVLDYNLDSVYVRAFGALGNQYADRWEYTPKTAGVFANAIQVYTHDYEELNNCDTRLVVKTASEKDSVSVLVIGDSTVDAGVETLKMFELAKADTGYSLTLLGTRGTELNRHEGRSGWTAARYVSERESAIGVKNAFYNPETKMFDFSYYMKSQGYSGVDCVFLQLGINDIFAAQTDGEMEGVVAAYIANMVAIVNSIKAYSENTKVVINLIIPGEADQDRFGSAYGVSQTAWRYKKNAHEANLALIDQFDDVENVYLSPFNAAIDTANNMNGDVHPNANGYNQLGEQMYSYLRAIT